MGKRIWAFVWKTVLGVWLISFAVFLFRGTVENWVLETFNNAAMSEPVKGRAMKLFMAALEHPIYALLTLSVLALCVGWAIGLAGRHKDAPEAPKAMPAKPKVKTIAQLFQDDFSRTLRTGKKLEVPITGGGKTWLEFHWCHDFEALTKYMTAYVPMIANPSTAEQVIADFAPAIETLKTSTTGLSVINVGMGGQHTATGDLVFSGRVFVYYDDLLNARQIANLIDHYKTHGFTLELRGADWLMMRTLRKS